MTITVTTVREKALEYIQQLKAALRYMEVAPSEKFKEEAKQEVLEIVEALEKLIDGGKK